MQPCDSFVPPKDLARAQRRHHADRLKKARTTYWGRHHAQFGRDYPLTERELGILLNTPAVCSCFGCCNPRRNGDAALDEARALQHSFAELLDDVPSGRLG